jgi:SRSO17 transposase
MVGAQHKEAQSLQ